MDLLVLLILSNPFDIIPVKYRIASSPSLRLTAKRKVPRHIHGALLFRNHQHLGGFLNNPKSNESEVYSKSQDQRPLPRVNT
jgi:hypothetical protein